MTGLGVTDARRRELPIIVGGCHRSGTSLVRRMLDAHSAIRCGPEVKFLIDFFGDYREDPHAHARFFATAESLAGRDELFERFGAEFVGLQERAAEREGKRRWADKNPENVLYTEAWDSLLPGGWILVHVRRDPRDVLASMEEAGFPYRGADALERRIEHWCRYERAAANFAARRPGDYVRVDYEDLVADPSATLRTLMSALGESYETGQLDLGAAADGLEDPKISNRPSVDAAGVGRWRRDLGETQGERILEAAAGLA